MRPARPRSLVDDGQDHLGLHRGVGGLHRVPGHRRRRNAWIAAAGPVVAALVTLGVAGGLVVRTFSDDRHERGPVVLPGIFATFSPPAPQSTSPTPEGPTPSRGDDGGTKPNPGPRPGQLRAPAPNSPSSPAKSTPPPMIGGGLLPTVCPPPLPTWPVKVKDPKPSKSKKPKVKDSPSPN